MASSTLKAAATGRRRGGTSVLPGYDQHVCFCIQHDPRFPPGRRARSPRNRLVHLRQLSDEHAVAGGIGIASHWQWLVGGAVMIIQGNLLGGVWFFFLSNFLQAGLPFERAGRT